MAVDISEQTEAGERLAESVRAKDRFVAIVSHELRTPLTAVVGFAHQLQRRVSELGPDETAAYVEMIREQAVEAGDLVEDLLVASRTESGNVTVSAEPTGLWGEVDAVLGARTFDAQVTVERTGAETKVIADPMRVRQIIRNLLGNAERYGGDRITVRVVERDDHASLFVIDNGPGVPDEGQSAMFEPFLAVPSSDRDPDSVGIGLSVSRSLARLMGGDLTYVYYRDHSFFELKLPTA